MNRQDGLSEEGARILRACLELQQAFRAAKLSVPRQILLANSIEFTGLADLLPHEYMERSYKIDEPETFKIFEMKVKVMK